MPSQKVAALRVSGKRFILAILMATLLSGCSQAPVVYTLTTGSHIRLSDEEIAQSQKSPRRKYVVWGNHQGAVNGAIELIQEKGETVVERARLQELLDEQKTTLVRSSEDATLLRIGKLVGADIVVFVETTERAERFTPGRSTLERVFLGLEAGGAHQQGRDPLYLKTPPAAAITLFRPGVTVRAVWVESGEVLWSGSSTFTHTVNDPEVSYPVLTKAAMVRANCPIEKGAEWIEHASDGSRQAWGCQGKR